MSAPEAAAAANGGLSAVRHGGVETDGPRGDEADGVLLDALVGAGLLDAARRRIVESERALAPAPLVELLVDGGFVAREALERVSGGSARIDLDGDDFVPDARAVACLDGELARRWRIVPLGLDAAGTTLTLASAVPPELPLRDRVRRAVPAALALRWRLASSGGIARALERCYGADLALESLAAACERALSAGRGARSAAGVARGSDAPPTARLVDALLSDALAQGASDIHLSPEERFLRVRYRVDGVLADARLLNRALLEAMVVRVKVLAGADIAETRRPQDGRFSRRVHGERVDFRFSSFPLRTGENLVLRVLERRRAAPDLAALAQPPEVLSTLRRLLRRPDGLLVVCGPTGAGKTTTLYALLGEHDVGALNVMTLEDPIEHPIGGVRQAAIDPARGIDFASGVRALLRQDPDVLLIGEIRDAESCAVALRAALTGHRVLTTVHARDAVAAIGRLRELGAEPGVLAEVLAGVVAQRLLRLRCTLCAGDGLAPGGRRCARCGGRALQGRRAVLETLLPTPALRTLIRGGADGARLARAAQADGHVTLGERARRLVAAGLTDAAELERVLGATSGEGGRRP